MQDQRGALCFFGVGVVATEIQYFPHTEFFQFPEASCGRLVRTIYSVSDPVEVFQPALITQGESVFRSGRRMVKGYMVGMDFICFFIDQNKSGHDQGQSNRIVPRKFL